jgi:hypothetical protein
LATGRSAGVINITANADGITSNIAKLTVIEAVIESIKDITTEAQISSDNPSVATFDVNNLMTAKGLGDAELSASYQGITSKRQFLHVNE